MCHADRASFWAVFWVDVSSPFTAETDLLEVAKAIGISANTTDDVLQILANRREN